MRESDGKGHGQDRAFSLLELVVVVAVIGILAALLLPAVHRATLKARQAQCLSNLRQVALAMQSFAHEHKDRFPMQVPAGDGGSAEWNRDVLSASTNLSFSPNHFRPLSNELASARVLACPADQVLPANSFGILSRTNISYWVNYRARPGNSAQILAGDRNATNLSATKANDDSFEVGFTRQLHQHRGNVAFADGHVELRKSFALREVVGTDPILVASPAPATPGQNSRPSASAPGAGRQRPGVVGGSGLRPMVESVGQPTQSPTAESRHTRDDSSRSESVATMTRPNSNTAVQRRARGTLPVVITAPEQGHVRETPASESAPLQSAPLIEPHSILKPKPHAEPEEEIPLFAAIRVAGNLLLLLFLLVLLARVLHHYVNRHSRLARTAVQTS